MNSVKRELKLFKGIKLIIGLMMFVFILTLTSCGDDDSGSTPPNTNDIVDVASATNDLSTLVTALGRFPDLVATLSDDDGSFTVFAPTNDAFSSLLTALNASSLDDIADDDLRAVLEYHVIAGSILRSTDLSDGATAATVEGTSVTVSISGTTIEIDNAEVTGADVEAINGIVHIIDEVLVPAGLSVVAQDVVDIASASLGGATGLDSLVAAVTLFPDIVALLSDQNENLTVFAPTNQAFVDLLGVIGQSKLADIPASVVERILQYHVIDGAELLSTGLSDGATATTVLDEDVTVGVSGSTVTINTATVTTADVPAANGVVHIVDAVLVPALELSIVNTIVEPAYFSVNFTTLTAAVVKADLLETLLGDGPFTLFAPTNDAFTAAGVNSLDDFTGEQLVPILQYHVLGSEVFASGLPATGSAITTLNGDFYLSINDNGTFINGNSQITVATNASEALDYDNGVVHVINRTLLPASSDIVQVAIDNGFNELAAALTRVSNNGGSDLISTLSSSMAADGAPFTVFAPTDAAFNQLYDDLGAGVSSVDDIAVATLEAVLLYHVVGDSRIFSSDLPNLASSTVTTLGGTFDLDVSTVTITYTDGALGATTDDTSTITGTDVLATNGVIHTVDKVLLP